MDLTDPASVVMTKGVASVLRVLAGADSAFTVRQLARVAGISPMRASELIRKLAAHGLVTTATVGSSLSCRLNRDHLLTAALVDLVTARARLVELLRLLIHNWSLAPLHASLYGSAARGDGTLSSDLDILVVAPPLNADQDLVWQDQLYQTQQRIEQACGNQVSWLATDVEGLRAAVEADEPILAQWRTEAVLLAGVKLSELLPQPNEEAIKARKP